MNPAPGNETKKKSNTTGAHYKKTEIKEEGEEEGRKS